MIEQSLIDQIFGSFETGKWSVFVGLVLIGLVTLVRTILRDRLSEALDKLVSALAAAVMTIGMLLAAGTDPLRSVMIGIFASAASAGLIDAIRDALPKRKNPNVAGAGPALLLCFIVGGSLLCSSGCGRCVAERGIVDALSAGIGAVDQSVGDSQDDDARLALDASRGAVLLGDAAVDSCEMLRDGRADGWESWVGLALEAAYGLVQIFTSAGPADDFGEVPPELLRAIDALGGDAP